TPTIANGKVFTSYPAIGGGGLNNQKPGILPKLKPKFKLPKKGALPDNFLPVVEPEQEDAKEPAKEGGAKQRPKATHGFICLELKTGKILWQKWIDSDVMSAPVAVDDEVYATSFAGTVYKFQQGDGAILSAQRSNATSAPVIVGKNVYLTQRADGAVGGQVGDRVAGLC